MVYRCDRCKAVSEGGIIDTEGGESELPDNWHYFDLPVRGSTGARSMGRDLICANCEDDLYAWLHPKEESE